MIQRFWGIINLDKIVKYLSTCGGTQASEIGFTNINNSLDSLIEEIS